MKKNFLRKAVRGLLCSLAMTTMLAGGGMEAFAYTTDDHPLAQETVDGLAFTIVEELPYYEDYYSYDITDDVREFSFWYEGGGKVSTGIGYNLPDVGVGQHLYVYERRGLVPVAEWTVNWEHAFCCHPGLTNDDGYHGLPAGDKTCFGAYWSGWFPICADCGEYIRNFNHYLSRETASSLEYYNVDKGYYYYCPHNGRFEQGIEFEPHDCKAVSWNMYIVRYDKNEPLARGEMGDSRHMYNNETEHNGIPVEPNKYLSPNEFVYSGFTFESWNTKPDGTGQRFEDCQEIFNLTDEEYNEDTGEGIITLYAQWKKSESTLIVDAKGGKYEDGIGTVNGDETTYANFPFGEDVELKEENLTPPSGYTVTFEPNGGSYVSPEQSEKKFLSWKKSFPSSFGGRFIDNVYQFIGPDGTVDRIEAEYENGSITLPTSTKEDSYLVAWYRDAELNEIVGIPGVPYTPTEDETLYAKWEQGLILYADNDLAVDGWKGGVDLTWQAADAANKIYKLYQKLESDADDEYYQLTETNDPISSIAVSETYGYIGNGLTKEYTVPHTGFYEFTATGAQGENYGEFDGGQGGKVVATYWLQKGHVLVIGVGGQGDGGTSTAGYGDGGGRTYVRNKTTGEFLLIAGGGGGASPAGNGGDGGESTSVAEGIAGGGNGAAGGGAGYKGGTAGQYILHEHDDDCKHEHYGDPLLGTGCYTGGSAVCGGTDFWDNSTIGGYYYCRGREDSGAAGMCKFYDYCVEPAPGHPWWYRSYKCKKCNATYSGYISECTNATVGYTLNCGKTDAYVCGYEEGDIESCTIAYGGSSYVSESAVSSTFTPGYREGDGTLAFKSTQLGFIASFARNDVSAPDTEAPDAIDENTIITEYGGGSIIKVTWSKPDDNGTTYNHKAESFDVRTGTHVCTSNITTNTITEGVYYYYYIYNDVFETNVTAANRQGVIDAPEGTDTSSLPVSAPQGEVRWLHVAPVDRAGNVGPTTDIMIAWDELSEWYVKSEQMSITSVVGGRNFGSVYHKDGDVYYVKADGRTPFSISYNSFAVGLKGDKAQIDNLHMNITSPYGLTQTFKTKAPHTALVAEKQNVPASSLVRSSIGSAILSDAMNSGVSRISNGERTTIYQAFTVKSAYNGQELIIKPTVGAEYVAFDGWTDTRWSDSVDDTANGIRIIPDGVAPDIHNAERLDDFGGINMATGETIEIHATDALSGVKSLKVEINNMDNGIQSVYTQSADGKVRISVTADNLLFYGDMQITLTAVDNVGNTNKIVYGEEGFVLNAKVSKVVPDGKTTYAKGEAAVLDVETLGYVDKVLIGWPVEFDTTLPSSFDYTANREFAQVEKLPFILPRYSNKTEYDITVTAYKDGVPQTKVLTLQVVGDILDRVRVRIR